MDEEGRRPIERTGPTTLLFRGVDEAQGALALVQMRRQQLSERLLERFRITYSVSPTLLPTFEPEFAISLIERFFSPEQLVLIGKKGGIKSFRDALTRGITMAEAQWKHESEKYIPRPKAYSGAPCFLCGLPFLPLEEIQAEMAGGKAQDHPLYPQCEHLIPSAATYLFFGMPGRQEYRYAFNNKEVLELNYRWAHRYCNGLKGASMFINLLVSSLVDGSYTNGVVVNKAPFELNRPLINKYLTDLWSSPSSGGQTLRRLADKGRIPAQSIIAFSFASIERAFEPMITTLNIPGQKQRLEACFFNNALDIVFQYTNLGGGKRKKTRKHKLKRKRTRRNKKSKK